ncbi:SRPBCC family protein [Nocardioides dilutus]
MSAQFEVIRRTSIAADPARVHALVNDFHQWPTWSPWEDVDPDMTRTFSGADAGVGARYAWAGNRKAGEGSMEIKGSTPERIDIELAFLKPFKATNHVDITFTPTGTGADGGTDVAWRMTGAHAGLAKLVFRFMSMDKMVGPDFEKGLAQLKALAESGR